MRTQVMAIAAILLATLTLAQTPGQVFDFTNKPSQQGLQEIVTILRTVGDIRQVSVDTSASTVTVQGTADDLAMSGWIVHQLDQPATDPPAATSSQQYLVAGKSDDVIRVFHLTNIGPKPPQGVQEILTVLRTVADIQKIFNYTPLSDLVVRGPAAQIALAGYLIDSLDVVKGSVASSQDFQYTSPAPGNGPEVVRVFYLAHAATPQAIQEILSTLRIVAAIQKVFNFTPLPAMAVRGSASDVATAEWLIQSLDVAAATNPGAAASAREFHLPQTPNGDTVIRVFYPTWLTTPQALSQTLTLLRTKLSVTKAYSDSSATALVVRGSADLIAKADQLIQQQDQPAGTSPPATPQAR